MGFDQLLHVPTHSQFTATTNVAAQFAISAHTSAYTGTGTAQQAQLCSLCRFLHAHLRLPACSCVQVLLPVYGSSCLVAILMHRRGVVVGRCVFKLYGLMPLLLRDHTKTLTLYRCAYACPPACLPACLHAIAGALCKLVHQAPLRKVNHLPAKLGNRC